MRLLGQGLGVLLVGAALYRQGASAWVWALLLAHGFFWPHLAWWIARSSDDPVPAEHRNLLIDSLLGGIWIALLHFNLLPSVLLVTMLAMNSIAIGGGKLLLRGLAVQIPTCLLVSTLNGFAFAPMTDMVEIIAAVPFLVIYPLALSAMMYRLTRHVRRQNRLLARLSSTDGLSELLNRTHWQQAVAGVLASGLGDRPASLLMIDIDHFKQINDRYGHVIGDEVIGRIGAIIRRSMREGDTAGRYGGDEFGVVLNGVDAATAAAVAERIRASVSKAAFDNATGLRCTLSIGVAQADRDTHDARDWIRTADEALYHAKHRGRDRLVTANWELNASAA